MGGDGVRPLSPFDHSAGQRPAAKQRMVARRTGRIGAQMCQELGRSGDRVDAFAGLGRVGAAAGDVEMPADDALAGPDHL